MLSVLELDSFAHARRMVKADRCAFAAGRAALRETAPKGRPDAPSRDDGPRRPVPNIRSRCLENADRHWPSPDDRSCTAAAKRGKRFFAMPGPLT